MALKGFRTCNHVKHSGAFCQSPALRHDEYCYFHRSLRERVKRQARNQRKAAPLEIPALEDRQTIQLAIGDVVNALLADRLDVKKAGLVLYALQTAALNSKDLHFQISPDDKHHLAQYSEHEQATLHEEITAESAESEPDDAAFINLPPKKVLLTMSQKCPGYVSVWKNHRPKLLGRARGGPGLADRLQAAQDDDEDYEN